MTQKNKYSLTFLAALLIASGSFGQSCNCPVTNANGVSVVTNNLNCTGITCVDNAGVIEITVSGASSCNGPGNIIVNATSLGVNVDSISVGLSGGNSDVVGMSVFALNGESSISHLGAISRGTGAGASLTIESVFVAGTISGNWYVTDAGTIEALNNIDANINCGSASLNVPGYLETLRSTNGSITGNITVNGGIGLIRATNGTVGTAPLVRQQQHPQLSAETTWMSLLHSQFIPPSTRGTTTARATPDTFGQHPGHSPGL